MRNVKMVTDETYLMIIVSDFLCLNLIKNTKESCQ